MASANPFCRGSRGWGMLDWQNRAAGEANGSIMVWLFVFLCLASKQPSEREIFVPVQTDYKDTELPLLLCRALKNLNVPHLGTGSLNLPPTALKNPYIVALMGLSYLTYYGTTFCLPYSWHNYTFFTYSFLHCTFYVSTHCINGLFIYLTLTNSCLVRKIFYFLFTSFVRETYFLCDH